MVLGAFGNRESFVEVLVEPWSAEGTLMRARLQHALLSKGSAPGRLRSYELCWRAVVALLSFMLASGSRVKVSLVRVSVLAIFH